MGALTAFIRLEAWCLIIAFFVLIAYQILTGKINTRGLLYGKEKNAGFSPARAQLLMLTPMAARHEQEKP